MAAGDIARENLCLRYCFIIDHRYRSHTMPAAVVGELRQRGHDVCELFPGESPYPYRVGAQEWQAFDFVVPRTRSLAGLSLLLEGELCGIPVLHRRTAIEAVRNKADMTVRLYHAGVPTLETWLIHSFNQLMNIPAGLYPLIIKPLFGDNGAGITILTDPDEPTAGAIDPGGAIVQPLAATDWWDLKLYVCGQRVWATRKPSPLAPPDILKKPAKVVPVEPAWEEIARSCGVCCNLVVYGVDCILRDGQVVVIEVNDFPNFSAIPEAAPALADLIADYSRTPHRGAGGGEA